METWLPLSPVLMLFETCWFYRKNYQSNKKCTEHKGCYSVFFLSLTNFELMFRGGLGISVFWGACRNQSVYFAYRIKWLAFLWAAGLRGTLDSGGTLAQIGLMYVLVVLVLFIYCISKDVIKSWGAPARQFLEYNYTFSYN